MTQSGGDDTGLWPSADLITVMAIRVAATLRIADHIARGFKTASELAAAVGAQADALDRLLRHLANVGVLVRDDSGRYDLTLRGETLRDDHPGGDRARLDIDGGLGHADLSFVHLLHSVRTGEPAFPVLFGRSFWEDLASDPLRAATFDIQMGSDIRADAPAIVSAYDWASLGHVVDVGGGNGSLLIALLTAHPILRGTVVELPHAAGAATRMLAAAGLAARCDVVAGSFFDPLPPGAGGYVLSAVIHNWGDEPARAILRRCAEAAGSNGADGVVLVIEKFAEDGASIRTEMDLRGLVYFGGKERSVTQLTALASDAGLELVTIHRAGATAILELT